jgi:hypothetical protein
MRRVLRAHAAPIDSSAVLLSDAGMRSARPAE